MIYAPPLPAPSAASASSRSYAPATPITGGIPVIFPQFGSGGASGLDGAQPPPSTSSSTLASKRMPEHGFARLLTWVVDERQSAVQPDGYPLLPFLDTPFLPTSLTHFLDSSPSLFGFHEYCAHFGPSVFVILLCCLSFLLSYCRTAIFYPPFRAPTKLGAPGAGAYGLARHPRRLRVAPRVRAGVRREAYRAELADVVNCDEPEACGVGAGLSGENRI